LQLEFFPSVFFVGLWGKACLLPVRALAEPYRGKHRRARRTRGAAQFGGSIDVRADRCVPPHDLALEGVNQALAPGVTKPEALVNADIRVQAERATAAR
jgi:hypothetical protein